MLITDVLQNLAKYALIVIIDLSDIQVKWDNANNNACKPLLLVFPYEFVCLCTRAFIAIVLHLYYQYIAQF